MFVFWAGIYPINGVWQRVDTYRGHFTSIAGGSSTNCFDPLLCDFSFDESLIGQPNLPKGSLGDWDDLNANGWSVVKEGNYNYLFYIGSNNVDCRTNEPNRWGMSLARSSELTVWEKKYASGEKPAIKLAGLYNTLGNPSDGCSFYGKLVKIGGQYWLYFLDMRSPNLSGIPISRNYRMSLTTNSLSNNPSDLNHDGKIDIYDYNQLITDFGKTGSAGFIPADINTDGKVDIYDYNILVGNFGKAQ